MLSLNMPLPMLGTDAAMKMPLNGEGAEAVAITGLSAAPVAYTSCNASGFPDLIDNIDNANVP